MTDTRPHKPSDLAPHLASDAIKAQNGTCRYAIVTPNDIDTMQYCTIARHSSARMEDKTYFQRAEVAP